MGEGALSASRDLRSRRMGAEGAQVRRLVSRRGARGRLEYAGKIEGGWTEQEKNSLLDEVRHLQTSRSPLANKIDKPKARWVEPRVLVDVEYRAKTKASGLLRHPSFKGIRRDLMDDLLPGDKIRRIG